MDSSTTSTRDGENRTLAAARLSEQAPESAVPSRRSSKIDSEPDAEMMPTMSEPTRPSSSSGAASSSSPAGPRPTTRRKLPEATLPPVPESPTRRATPDVPHNLFSDKRRKIDQSETSWMRRIAPVEMPVDDNDLEVDVLVGEEVDPKLPAGWRVGEAGCFVLTEECLNIQQRLLTAPERAEFSHAKRKELTEFFSNEVWDVASDKTTDDRILKARWLLKWSKNPDGTPRAKARLIIQGYNDPDALAGKVATSAPTLTRIGKYLTLQSAVIKGWRCWIADVATAFLQGGKQNRVLQVRVPQDAAEMIGIDKEQPMALHKPMYGQVDAPRGWYLEASARLTSIGLRPHPLDPCIFMSYNEAGEYDGFVDLYVDDMLGAGCMDGEGDNCYRSRIEKLKAMFNFRTWQDDDKMEYCGSNIEQTATSVTVKFETYAKKLKPMTANQKLPDDASRPLDKHEVRQLRGLVGALQWPASQACPHLQASVSYLQGDFPTPTIKTLQEANRVLRFFKSNVDVGIEIKKVANELTDVTFVAMTDATWASRNDGSSQGGYLILACGPEVLEGQTSPFSTVDWKSHRMPRLCRSSLQSEGQAAVAAVDSLEYIKVFWACMLRPDVLVDDESLASQLSKSTLVVDAKSLYDAARREHLGSFADKRTGIDILCLKERMTATQSSWRWVSSERQYADGMTKPGVRQVLADRLRQGMLSLIHDPNFVAARKKPAAERLGNISSSRSSPPRNKRAKTSPAVALLAMAPSLSQATTCLVSTVQTNDLCQIETIAQPSFNWSLWIGIMLAAVVTLLTIGSCCYYRFFNTTSKTDAETQTDPEIFYMGKHGNCYHQRLCRHAHSYTSSSYRQCEICMPTTNRK